MAQSTFEIIDYRYRFSTERFIVPITASTELANQRLFLKEYKELPDLPFLIILRVNR